MKKLVYILFAFLALSAALGCSHSVDKRLVLADTLMWTNPDSSLSILIAINRDSLLGDENLAYHALLLTQAQFRCNGNCTDDSLINFALEHYSDNHNREHYTRALLYKGAYYEFHTNQPVEAIKWYKQAESIADTIDYRNLAQINMRLGLIYHNSYISTGEDISKFKKSLHYYSKLGMKKNELLCLLYIGQKLRVSNNSEAVKYLQQAEQLATELKDTISIVNSMECLARYNFYNNSYEVAHRIAQTCINSYPNHLNEDIILDEARACTKLGKIDSASMYINLVESPIVYDVSHVYRLYTLADIALAKGDNMQYIKNKLIADSICDIVQIKRDSLKLPQAENIFNEYKIQQTYSKKELFKLVTSFLACFIVIAIIGFWGFYYKKNKEWNNLLDEHRNANNELLKKNIEVSNVNAECKTAVYELLQKIDSWVKMNQSVPKELFASKFEKSFMLGKKKKEIRIETGDFWLNMQSLADATFGKDLKNLKDKYPKLSKDDLYIIALKYLGFSYITIAVCMGYEDKSYVNKKKDRIPKKLGLDMTFDDFLYTLKNKSDY